jgi:hypothetical protein
MVKRAEVLLDTIEVLREQFAITGMLERAKE